MQGEAPGAAASDKVARHYNRKNFFVWLMVGGYTLHPLEWAHFAVFRSVRIRGHVSLHNWLHLDVKSVFL